MKKYLFRFILILMITAIAELSVCAVYYLYFRHNIRSEYENVYKTALDSAAFSLDEKLNDAFKLIEDGSPVPEGYLGAGILKEKEIRMDYQGGYHSHIINEKQFNRFSGRDRGNDPDRVVSRAKLFGYDLIVYAVKDGDEYRTLFEDYQAFKSDINLYGMDQMIIADTNGIIIASTETESSDLINDAYPGMWPLDSGKYVDFDKKGYFVIKEDLDVKGHYLIGAVSSAKIDRAIYTESQRTLIFVSVVAAVSFLGVGGLIILYLNLNSKNLAGSFMRGKYCLVIDKYGKIIKRNKKFAETFSNKDIVDCTVDSNAEIMNALKSNGDITLKFTDKKGEERYIRFMTAETLAGYRLAGTDVTAFMNDYKEAKYLARCDRLTKLPDFEQLEEDYKNYLEKFGGEKFCVMIFDIVGLEKYKTMFGVSFYEALKVRFARRLSSIFENMVYQTGDTRFTVLTHTEENTKYLTQNTDKYTALLAAPIKIDNQCLKLDFKGGFSKPFYGKEKLDLNMALGHASQALLTAMNSPDKKVIGFFDALLRSDMAVYESKKAIIDLIENDQIALYYQPQFSIKENRITGFEALIRIKKKINISILEFVELAEKNGSIIELGNYVYKNAMAFAKSMEKYNIRISLNVSPVQLMQEGFVENFLQYYRSYNLKPHSVSIEITESFLMSVYDLVIKNLTLLHKEGIDIHLDDFGVVYSSMLYLKKLPINAIKIDQGFIKDIKIDSYSKMIVDIITKSAKHLNLSSIAEGVETEAQAKLLKELGCDYIQGYYISPAVPAEEAQKLIAAKTEGNKEV